MKILFGMLASLLALQGKEHPVEHPTFYRTIQIDHLAIFYRDAGPNDAPTRMLSRTLRSAKGAGIWWV